MINRGCASGNLSFAHELGHNFGALHDPYVDPGTSPYAYGHGHAAPAARWRTVMAYNNVCSAAGTSCARIPYFSNPNLSYGSPAQPLGTASTSDNARVHNQNATTVANFRASGASGCTFALSPSSVDVAAAPPNGSTSITGSTSVTAGAGCAWSAVSNASWLSLGAGSATRGPGTLNYAVAANTGPARSGSIAVGGVKFTVSQANGCTYALSSARASIPASGGAGSVTLTTGVGCTWTASSSATPWLTVSPPAGSGSATVNFAAAANASTSVRSANLSIGGATFVVTEAAAAATAPVPTAPVATLSATSVNFGNQRINTTSAARTVRLTNTGSGTLTIKALTAGGANPSEFARSGTCALNTALKAGRSCTVVHTFKPTVANSRSATLTLRLASASSDGTLALALTGTGTRR